MSTYSGYMAPEYAVNGHFLVKSDVFSFEILLLEIITGKKNTRFYYPSDNVNLYGHVTVMRLFSYFNMLNFKKSVTWLICVIGMGFMETRKVFRTGR